MFKREIIDMLSMVFGALALLLVLTHTSSELFVSWVFKISTIMIVLIGLFHLILIQLNRGETRPEKYLYLTSFLFICISFILFLTFEFNADTIWLVLIYINYIILLGNNAYILKLNRNTPST
jgi:hypothetical protein